MFPQQPDVPGVIFNHQDAHGASSLPAVAPFFGNTSQPEISGRFDDGLELLQIQSFTSSARKNTSAYRVKATAVTKQRTSTTGTEMGETPFLVVAGRLVFT
jgi:hypothetical protein